jgi:hypothetical protein
MRLPPECDSGFMAPITPERLSLVLAWEDSDRNYFLTSKNSNIGTKRIKVVFNYIATMLDVEPEKVFDAVEWVLKTGERGVHYHSDCEGIYGRWKNARLLDAGPGITEHGRSRVYKK